MKTAPIDKNYTHIKQVYKTKHVYECDVDGKVINTLEIIIDDMVMCGEENGLDRSWVMGVSGKGYVFHKLEFYGVDHWSKWYTGDTMIKMGKGDVKKLRHWIDHNTIQMHMDLPVYKGDMKPLLEKYTDRFSVCDLARTPK